MPPDRPLLTIAIPTYNRGKYLAQLLAALAPQLRDRENVELIISDNSSPDDTPELIRQFVQNGLKVRYIRNATNIGADANFLQCFEEARGKYFWLFGDDDLIVPEGLDVIMQYLSGSDYDLLYLISYAFESDPVAEWTKRRSFGPPAIATTNARHVASLINILLSFVTAVIVNKERVDELSHPQFSSLIGTNLIHMAWIFTLLDRHRRTLYVNRELIAYRRGNSVGWDIARLGGPALCQVSHAAFLRRPELAKLVINGTIGGWLTTSTIQARRGRAGALSCETPHSQLKPLFKNNFRYWVCLYPVISLPIRLGAIWAAAVRAVNKVRRVLTVWLLLRLHRVKRIA